MLQTVLVLPMPRGDETNVCVSVAFEALFVIAQVWKYMSIDDKSIKKLWDVCVYSVHTYEYYLAIKRRNCAICDPIQESRGHCVS